MGTFNEFLTLVGHLWERRVCESAEGTAALWQAEEGTSNAVSILREGLATALVDGLAFDQLFEQYQSLLLRGPEPKVLLSEELKTSILANGVRTLSPTELIDLAIDRKGVADLWEGLAQGEIPWIRESWMNHGWENDVAEFVYQDRAQTALAIEIGDLPNVTKIESTQGKLVSLVRDAFTEKLIQIDDQSMQPAVNIGIEERVSQLIDLRRGDPLLDVIVNPFIDDYTHDRKMRRITPFLPPMRADFVRAVFSAAFGMPEKVKPSARCIAYLHISDCVDRVYLEAATTKETPNSKSSLTEYGKGFLRLDIEIRREMATADRELEMVQTLIETVGLRTEEVADILERPMPEIGKLIKKAKAVFDFRRLQKR